MSERTWEQCNGFEASKVRNRRKHAKALCGFTVKVRSKKVHQVRMMNRCEHQSCNQSDDVGGVGGVDEVGDVGDLGDGDNVG